VDKNGLHRRRLRHHARRQARLQDGENFYIRDGIVIIPKNAILPAGTWI